MGKLFFAELLLFVFCSSSVAVSKTCSSEDGYDYWGYDLGKTKNVTGAAGGLPCSSVMYRQFGLAADPRPRLPCSWCPTDIFRVL